MTLCLNKNIEKFAATLMVVKGNCFLLCLSIQTLYYRVDCPSVYDISYYLYVINLWPCVFKLYILIKNANVNLGSSRNFRVLGLFGKFYSLKFILLIKREFFRETWESLRLKHLQLTISEQI